MGDHYFYLDSSERDLILAFTPTARQDSSTVLCETDLGPQIRLCQTTASSNTKEKKKHVLLIVVGKY